MSTACASPLRAFADPATRGSGWLVLHPSQHLSLSTRALAELNTYLRDTFNAQDDDDETDPRHRAVVDCDNCLAIVTSVSSRGADLGECAGADFLRFPPAVYRVTPAPTRIALFACIPTAPTPSWVLRASAPTTSMAGPNDARSEFGLYSLSLNAH